MSELSEAIEEARSEVALAAADFMPDLCSFSKPNSVEVRDADGYVTTPEASALSNIPCKRSRLSAYERQSGGKTTEGATDKLQIPATAATMLVNGTYTGVIQARGIAPAIPFRVTGQLTESDDLFVCLAITA